MGVQTRPHANAQAPIAHVPPPRQQAAREALGVGVVLLLAILLRLVLAARAWPLINSDEATLGLMADDIRWHGAHPVFFYGQQYMGALQAYLTVPVFAVFGPTVLALHILTTLQFALFALALYAFTRAVYSPPVAWLTLAILAFGPPSSLFFELRAGAGTQDTLVLGALLLWLTLARLRHPQRRRARLALDIGIGLAAGLAVWGDFLILPFVATCVGALAVASLRRARSAPGSQRLRDNILHPLAGGLAFLLGAAPLLAANIASRGATFAQALSKTGVSTAGAHPALLNALVALPWQVAATLLVGIPNLLGSSVVCARCAIWPIPYYQGTAVAALGAVAVALPFAAGALTAWALAAWPLARDVRQRLLPFRSQATSDAMREPGPPIDPRWWGQALLVAAMALTVLAYMASPVSYTIPAGSGRYLVGLYVGVPLVAAPLWQDLAWLREHHATGAGLRRWWSRPLVVASAGRWRRSRRLARTAGRAGPGGGSRRLRPVAGPGELRHTRGRADHEADDLSVQSLSHAVLHHLLGMRCRHVRICRAAAMRRHPGLQRVRARAQSG